MQEITQHAYETQMSADHFERTEKDTKKIYIYNRIYMELSAVNSCSAALIITTIVGWCVHIVHRAYIVQFVCVRLIELRTHLTIRNMNGSCIKMLSIPFHISVYLLSSRDFCFFFVILLVLLATVDTLIP